MPNIDDYLPCPVSLFFKDRDVLAAVSGLVTAGVSHQLFVGAAHIGEISGLGYFNLGRLPSDGSTRTRQHFFPRAANCFLRHCPRSIWRHDNSVTGGIIDCLTAVLGSRR